MNQATENLKNQQIVERLKKELEETQDYLDNYPNYEGSGTVEVKKRIVPILQTILGEENGN
jgi:hypothetical protein